jgi:hypothetical protein
MGWLLPTLLLTWPDVAKGMQQRQRPQELLGGSSGDAKSRIGSWLDEAAARLELWVQGLLVTTWPSDPSAEQPASALLELPIPAGMNLLLRWLATLALLWLACCAVAPLFVPLQAALVQDA